jgi:hypothetical protein
MECLLNKYVFKGQVPIIWSRFSPLPPLPGVKAIIVQFEKIHPEHYQRLKKYTQSITKDCQPFREKLSIAN